MNCLIIEDEKPAQRVLEQFIKNSPGLVLSGTYKTAMDAQAKLNQGGVDLLFLDINLPLISGIALLKSLKNPPLVVVTTAYSEYALESFELDVVDYLLKPFSFERFVKATNKAFKLKGAEENTSHAISQEVNSEQVIVNVDKVLYKLNLSDICYVASDKDYVCIYTAQRKYVFLDSLKNWEEKLKDKGFCRIHKSYLVNLGHIAKVEGNTICLDKLELPIGRSYRSRFMAAFVS
ncbi:MAG: response regulator transcription factor [Roseivirga sp.]|nr:response regulator transcription factor [Roseivirga sp.]